MKTRNALLGVGLVVAALTAGCAEVPRQDSISQSRVGLKPVSQREAADQAFAHRRQAAELREMARRLELETNVYGQQGDEASERARAGRERANAMRAAAEAAERVAREYQRYVPHSLVF